MTAVPIYFTCKHLDVSLWQSLWDELNNWLERLTELDAAVQELFGQASPHSERHNKQADMLSQRYQQARCLAEHRDGLLAKVLAIPKNTPPHCCVCTILSFL